MKSSKIFLTTVSISVTLFFAGLSSAAHAAMAPKQSGPDEATKARVTSSMMKLPLRFEENKGQVDKRVRFLSRGQGYSLFLTPTEAVLSLRTVVAGEKGKTGAKVDVKASAIKYKTAVLRMKLEGASKTPKMAGGDMLDGRSNYFIGNDQSKWHTGVANYKNVKYNAVYPGIDLLYYGTNQRTLEYDFVVSPGADPNEIGIVFDGASSFRIREDGALIIGMGDSEVVLKAPVSYQTIDGARVHVDSHFVLKGERRVAFAVDDYDVKEKLVIDPTLTYSTYLGGNGTDQGHGIVVDGSGNAYVTGWSQSTNFPTTASPIQGTYGGVRDAFVTKINAGGSAWAYSSYLGGTGDDIAYGIAVDGSGNAYVTGYTWSTNFPVISGAIQASHGGGASDAFVTKINAAGSALTYSTYLGGGGNDTGWGIAVDGSGNAYVSGDTVSTNFPTSASPIQGTFGGVVDAFVTKINAVGSALIYSTYLGGSGDDSGLGIAVDGSGNAYVTGKTDSPNFPTSSPIQGTKGGALTTSDAFVTKINAGGTAWSYSTYLGGNGNDAGWGIAVDGAGNAYVTGDTPSTDFPTASPIQGTNGGGGRDAFVTKVNAAGTALTYSTYLGGSFRDYGKGISVDGSGTAYVTGYTASTDFPTKSPIQGSHAGGTWDTFVTKVHAGGTALVYSTYLGGSNDDQGHGIVVDGSGNAYVTGPTVSTNFPTKSPIQGTFGGVVDAFVTKISAAAVPTPSDFNGDGNSDILWRHATTGQNAIWMMNGAAVVAGTGLINPVTDLDWKMVGKGDFDKDGKADILWRHATTGQNAIWLMNGTTAKAGSALISPVTDLNWKVMGVGDFNKDGKSDILWRNQSTGQNAIWMMNGTTVAAGTALIAPAADLNWKMVGTGDFDSDGMEDILWRHATTGQNAIWLMNGTTVKAGSALISPVTDLNWKIAATGDFNKDGKSDILWRDQSSGQNAIWMMNGTTVAAGTALITAVSDLNWKIAGTGDFDQDGRSDILWRHATTGQNAIWFMNGTTVKAGSALIATVGDLNWNIQ